MAYQPSPKPDFDKPTHIKYDLIEPYMWGDEKTGKVKDWIVSKEKLFTTVAFFDLSGVKTTY